MVSRELPTLRPCVPAFGAGAMKGSRKPILRHHLPTFHRDVSGNQFCFPQQCGENEDNLKNHKNNLNLKSLPNLKDPDQFSLKP